MSAPKTKSKKTVANLLPNHHFARNLFLRNGTFYIRKMIAGKRFVKSLHTNDPYLAIHILQMWQISGIFDIVDTDTTNLRLKEIKTLFQKLNGSEYMTYKQHQISKDKNMILIEKYKLYVRPNILSTNKHELAKYDTMMRKMTNYLGNCQETDVLADPHMLEGMIEHLSSIQTKSGTFLAKKTLHEYAKLFKRLFDRASDKELVAGIMNTAIRTHCKAVTKQREPLGESHFPILFKAMNKLISGDLEFIDKCIQDVGAELQHTTGARNKSKLYFRIRNLKLIKQQPETIYYAILLMLLQPLDSVI